MKKLLMGTIVLCLFAIAVSLIQVSCSKTDAQQNQQNTISSLVQLNKIVFSKEIPTGGAEIWTANYDGTNQIQVPVALPPNFYIASNVDHATRLSPDGQTIFFLGNYTPATPGIQSSIYACNIDGSNFRLVVQGGPELMRLGGAY